MAILVVAGCATNPPTAEEEAEQREDDRRENAEKMVRLTANPDAVRGCTPLGNVRGSSTNILGTGSENVEEEMKEKAAKLGGNVVFVMSSQTHRYSEGTGEVYRCETPTPTPTPAR